MYEMDCVCVCVCQRERVRERERERERFSSLFALYEAMNFDWNFLTVESNDVLDQTLSPLEKIFPFRAFLSSI